MARTKRLRWTFTRHAAYTNDIIMCCVKNIVLFTCIQNMICANGFNKYYSVENVYRGQSFPISYLLPDDMVSSATELEYYLKKVHLTVNYFIKEIKNYNHTEINRALGMFFMKAVLKRALLDHRNKLKLSHYNILKDVINKGDYFVSHYVYTAKETFPKNHNDRLEYRVAQIMKNDAAQVYSIGAFNKGRLQKWLHSNFSMHSYVEKMDNLTLPREYYAFITENIDSYFLSVGKSDKCLSHVVYNPEPIVLSELRQCVPDLPCKRALLSSPSPAYALSHRLLNLLMLRHSRRCYIQTEKEDDDLMDNLCSSMYRVAVYIARRGYFARDLFLEHVALCSLLGYEEFFRLQWFRKIASWMDDQGCIYESSNFLINRSRLQIQREKDIKKIQLLRKRLKWTLLEECHSHPMALLTIVLAQAIRYLLQYMEE